MPRHRRTAVVVGSTVGRVRIALALVVTGMLLGLVVPPATAQDSTAPPPDPVEVARRAGEAWLSGRQQPDGGFAVGGLPGVETPESVLALAEGAQTSDVWSAREGIDRIDALDGDGAGNDAAHALSLLSRDLASPRDAALLITRVALPLQIEPTAFDPSGSGRGRNLVSALERARPGDSTSLLADVVAAQAALGAEIPESLVESVLARQLDDGGWAPEVGGQEMDVTTTSGVVAALIAAGRTVDDPAVRNGLVAVAQAQHDDGGWGDGHGSRPADTGAAMGAIRSSGFDPDAVCWQEDLLGTAPDRPAPSAYLVDSQAPAGNWGSADETVSTAVALQGLSGLWLPLARAEARSCGGGFSWPLPTVPPSLLVLAGVGVIGLLGSVRILRGNSAGF